MSPYPSTTWDLPHRHVGRRVLVFDQLESTSTLALDLAQDPVNDGLAILAREQTAGRGQYGRSWLAPPGSSVLMSLILLPPLDLRRPALLTAWVAVSVCDFIQESTGLEARIKWPNDVLVQGKKVCGILIEQRQKGVRSQEPGVGGQEAGKEQEQGTEISTAYSVLSTQAPTPSPLNPLPNPHTPLPAPPSPLSTPHSPLPTSHSPLPTSHSPLSPHHSPIATVVGIGLNVTQPAEVFARANLPLAGSLFSLSGKKLASAEVARQLLAHLERHYDLLFQGDLTTLESLWRRRLGLQGKPVIVELAQSQCQGRLRTLAFAGLELELTNGQIQNLVPEMVRHLERMEPGGNLDNHY